MTENEARSRLASIALSYVGATEGGSMHKYIIAQYNKIRPLPRAYEMKLTDEWCAAFVSFCAQQAAMLSIIPAECGCEEMIHGFQRAGRWMESDNYRPKMGDIYFYDWQDSGNGDCTGWADHVGIVVAASASGFTTVEGNRSNAVKQVPHTYDAVNTRGFGLPDFAAYAAACNSNQKEQAPSAWAADAVKWAKENGISDGKNPQQTASREQVITMLYRFYQKFMEE